MFLRLPGQWDDEAWREASLGAGIYYNVHRWYQATTGRYSRVDPIRLRGYGRDFSYARSSPIGLIDPLGLAPAFPGCEGWCPKAGVTPGSYADQLLGAFNDVVKAGQSSKIRKVRECYEGPVPTGLAFIRCESDDRCREVGSQQSPPATIVGGFWSSTEPTGISLCPRAPGLPGYSGCALGRILAHEIGHFCTGEGHPGGDGSLGSFFNFDLEVDGVPCPGQ